MCRSALGYTTFKTILNKITSLEVLQGCNLMHTYPGVSLIERRQGDVTFEQSCIGLGCERIKWFQWLFKMTILPSQVENRSMKKMLNGLKNPFKCSNVSVYSLQLTFANSSNYYLDNLDSYRQLGTLHVAERSQRKPVDIKLPVSIPLCLGQTLSFWDRLGTSSVASGGKMVSTAGSVMHNASGPSHLPSKPFWVAMAIQKRSLN